MIAYDDDQRFHGNSKQEVQRLGRVPGAPSLERGKAWVHQTGMDLQPRTIAQRPGPKLVQSAIDFELAAGPALTLSPTMVC